MEAAVERLEAMFLKSEADLDYIERRLKLDFINSAADNGYEENVAVMLENLKAIKSKHSTLCTEVKEIATAHNVSMDTILNHIRNVTDVVRVCHDTSGVEAASLTESEQEAAALLGSETSPGTTAADQQQPERRAEDGELSAAMLEAVPLDIRCNVKLAELRASYQQLQQHLSSGSLSLQRMKQLKVSVSDAKLKVLQHLGLVALDGRGHVRLLP